jgi:hypothetical protein
MARLSYQQWSVMRAIWENDPRPGFSWLCSESGGPWSVSREAVRQHAAKECWRKLPSVAGSAQQADDQPVADSAIHGKIDERLDGGKFVEVSLMGRSEAGHQASEVTELNNDLRNELLDKHKREWGSLVRSLIYETAREARMATGIEKARMTRIVVDCMRVLHQAEADVRGLQALHINWDDLSVEELRAIYEKGKLPS